LAPGGAGQAIAFCGLPTHKQRKKAPPALAHGRTGLSDGPHYFDGVAAVAPLVFLGAFLDFFTGFVVLAVAVAAWGEALAAAGLAGVACAANVKGIVATARAIASNLVFIFPSFRRVSSARSQFHVAPEALEAR
jgi:hypothetical protein